MSLKSILYLCTSTIILVGCNTSVKEVNIGAILPLSEYAVVLGEETKNTYLLVIDEYNSTKKDNEPKINLVVEDGQWGVKKELTLEKYNKLHDQFKCKTFLISNFSGTAFIEDEVIKDNSIVVNPFINNEVFSKLNRNFFKIAPSTYDEHADLAESIIDKKLKNIDIVHLKSTIWNDRASVVKTLLDEENIRHKSLKFKHKEIVNYDSIIKQWKHNNTDGIVFLGGTSMYELTKRAIAQRVKIPMFWSTNLVNERRWDTVKKVDLNNVEYTFFTELDGNYILANQFLQNYKKKYHKMPDYISVNLQAYDAISLLIDKIRTINTSKDNEISYSDWLRRRLYRTKYYQGVSGNLSISEDGSVIGIKPSVYKITEEGRIYKKRYD
ncbi:ABC transporter substrate-binding protein [Flavobacteriaceae bacterium]|nr:ABC transporter substrate-binding protein [Flavobacteriaceae bacterium]